MGPLVIVNPHAAGGRAGRTFAQVRSVLERRLGALDAEYTVRPGHAIELAREASKQGRSLIVAVGGDGTLHEVVNGVLDAGGTASVGYVGQGTGGDFRRTLGVEHRLDAYIDLIAQGRDRAIDVGKLTFRSIDGAPRTRWFVNILSAGMGGLVDRHVARTSKVLGGKAAYLWAGVRALLESERAKLRCRVGLGGADSVREVDAYMIAICNGRYFGSGMHVAPMAQPDDGRFEVIAMDAPSKLAFAAFSRTIYGGTHLSAPGVQHFACDRITLDRVDADADRAYAPARDAYLLDVDGEPLGLLPVEVVLVPGALRFRA